MILNLIIMIIIMNLKN